MGNIAWMSSHFRTHRHWEFILCSILPVLAATLARQRGGLAAWQQRMQRMERGLLDAAPWVGRYCWETVIVLDR